MTPWTQHTIETAQGVCVPVRVYGKRFGAGPIVGGLLIERFGWPAIFWVNVPIGIAGFVVALAAVRESLPEGTPIPNLADIIQEKAEKLLEQVCMPVQG